MSRLEQALIEIAQFLAARKVSYMVIGGIANVVWGIPRTTLDVDITIWVAEDQLEEFTSAVTQQFVSRVEDPTAFVRATRVLPLATKDGTRIDLIFGQLPYEDEAIRQAVHQTVQGVEVRVCRPEDLIIHKLVSERPKDHEDVRGILRCQAKGLDRSYLNARVTELAHALDRPEIQSWYQQCLQEADASP